MGVAVGDDAAVNVQPGQGRQVGFPQTEEKVLDVGDLGERGGVTAGDIEHPVVAGPVGGAGDEPGNVGGVLQHAEVAAQQVFRCPGWPAPLTVILRPGVQALPVLLQARLPEGGGGGRLQFLVSQDVDRRRGAGLPDAGAGW